MADPVVRPRTLLRSLALVASLTAFAWGAEWLVTSGMLSERWVDAEVAGQGWRGYAAFVAVGTLATALGGNATDGP